MIRLIEEVFDHLLLGAESLEDVQFDALDERQPAARRVVDDLELADEEVGGRNALVRDEPSHSVVVNE